MRYKEFYDEIRRLLELRDNVFPFSDSFYYKAFNKRRADILFKHVNPLPNEKILDIGCGYGDMLILLNNPSLRVGLEISSHAIKQASTDARKKKNICFINGEAQSLPFQDEQFDKVLCSHVIEHLPNPQLLIADVYRVLKSGGGVFVCLTPNASYAGHAPKLSPVVKPLFIAFCTVSALLMFPFIKEKRSVVEKIKEFRKISQELEEVIERFGAEEHIHDFRVIDLENHLKDSKFCVKSSSLMGLHGEVGPISGISLRINDTYGKLWNRLAVFLERRSSMRLKECLLCDLMIVSEKN